MKIYVDKMPESQNECLFVQTEDFKQICTLNHNLCIEPNKCSFLKEYEDNEPYFSDCR